VGQSRASPGSRTRILRVEGARAVRCASDACVPRRGLEPRSGSLKGSDAAITPARRRPGGDRTRGCFPRYKLGALTTELPASWPPRNRTERYLFIRQAPSTSWVAASGRRRTRTPALSRPAGFKPQAARLAASSSLRKAEALIPSACAPSPLRTGARAWRVHFPWRKTENSNPRRLAAPRGFRPGASIPLASSSRAEGGLLESHASRRASASNGARLACPVHPPCVRWEGVEPSRPKAPVPGTGAAAITPPALDRDADAPS
jgi:hypothetical protein